MSLQLSSKSLVSRKTIVFVVSLGFLVNQASSEANFCGRKDPEPDKVCISTRLPWQIEPIYFCADQCQNAQCPPKPFNRTCEVIPPKNEEPWDCCPKYACQNQKMGQEMPGDCHLKQLEPGCMSPPKNKTNCVGFIDPHIGCCTQFQCDGDGKPGMCPMQMAAMKYSSPMNMSSSSPASPSSMHSSSIMAGMAMVKSPGMMTMPGSMFATTGNGRSRRAATMKPKPKGSQAQSPNVNMVNNGEPSGGPGDNSEIHRASGSYNSYANYGNNNNGGVFVGGGNQHSISIAVEPYHNHSPLQFHLSCVGDQNCPGSMKCCSNDLSVYSDGSSITRNVHPTYGYCVEPMM